MNTTPHEQTRLFRGSVKNGDCILYGGSKDKDGYGVFFFRQKTRRAHRVTYWATHGDIPKDRVVNHTCGNRACINIAHLELLTVRDNNFKDSKSLSYFNSIKTHCPQGHPYDRKYGNQRYCSICDAAKKKRLRVKWLVNANKIGC